MDGIPTYIYNRLSIFEKLKLYMLNVHATCAMKMMDYYIRKHHKACKYQDLMYRKDAEIYEFSKRMRIKYA